MLACTQLFIFFFFNDTATTEIYTLSLHDALPISLSRTARDRLPHRSEFGRKDEAPDARVPSSHETKQGEPGRVGPLPQAPSERAYHAPAPCRHRVSVQRR